MNPFLDGELALARVVWVRPARLGTPGLGRGHEAA